LLVLVQAVYVQFYEHQRAIYEGGKAAFVVFRPDIYLTQLQAPLAIV